MNNRYYWVKFTQYCICLCLCKLWTEPAWKFVLVSCSRSEKQKHADILGIIKLMKWINGKNIVTIFLAYSMSIFSP